MIDVRRCAPGTRRFRAFVAAMLLTVVCAGPSPAASDPVPAPGAEPVSGSADDSALDDFEPLPEKPAVRVADPIEPVNRALFVFNDRLYFWLLKPVARGYAFVVPEPVRVGIRNALTNVVMPVRLVNSLLQGKGRGAGRELARFTINTTIGMGGLFDTAKDDWGIAPSEEDTGQTFGTYGLGHGAYLVLPIFGPSSIRDGVGLGADAFLSPLLYLVDFPTGVAIRAGQTVNATSLRIGEYEDIKAAAIDPYLAIRDGYVQHREGQVAR